MKVGLAEVGILEVHVLIEDVSQKNCILIPHISVMILI